MCTLATKDGTQLAGMITNEGANSVTLMDLNGQQRQILRANIQSLTGLGRSLMPEGFEQVFNDQQLAHLIAHINASANPPKSFPGNKPKLVSEENDSLTLTALNAEIYGDSLMFEEKHRNLGFWRSLNDRAAWSIKTKQAGVYDVHLNWALDGKAKANRIQLRIGQNEIVHAVDSTGTWDQYRSIHIGTVELDEGEQRTIMQAITPISGFVIDLKSVKLTRKTTNHDLFFYRPSETLRSPDDHVTHSSRDQNEKNTAGNRCFGHRPEHLGRPVCTGVPLELPPHEHPPPVPLRLPGETG